MAYGKHETDPKQRKYLKRYYKKNRNEIKKEMQQLRTRHAPSTVNRPGGLSKDKRKIRRKKDYPEHITQPSRSSTDFKTGEEETTQQIANELLNVARLLIGSEEREGMRQLREAQKRIRI